MGEAERSGNGENMGRDNIKGLFKYVWKSTIVQDS